MPNSQNKHKRTAHRWPLIGMMIGGVFLALGSFWLVQVMQDPETAGNGAKSSEPDYIVENFSVVRMTPDGKPGYVISGASLSHRPDVDVSDIDKPVMHNMTPGRPPMTVTAKTAKVLNLQNQVELAGDVDVQRPAMGATKALRIRSQALTALPDEEIVKTALPVEIQLGAATLKGVGMEANNATQKLRVNSRTQIVYPPRQAR